MSIEQFNIANIFFCDAVKNNIIKDSNFTKILYITPYCSINSIYIHFTLLSSQKTNKHNYLNNKMKYMFIVENNNNMDIINALIKIEEDILNIMNITNKMPIFKIKENLLSGTISCYQKTTDYFDNYNENIYVNFIIKISGIWENNTQYGINFKINKIHP